MARGYIRPDLSKALLAELVPANICLLINPTWEELKAALTGIQRRTRKNGLPIERLRQIFDTSQQAGFFSMADSSALEAPSWYGYDYPCTQVAACHLGDGITAFVLARTQTPPGDPIPSPLYLGRPSQPHFDPHAWLDSVCMTFWTRLTDDDIEAIERKAIGYAMVIAARRKQEALRNAQRLHESAEGAEKHVHSQLDILFTGVRPHYTTHVAQACGNIADVMDREGRVTVTWREFKQRWSSVADRYRNDLLPVVDAGMVAATSLRQMQGQRLFSLSFGLWTGSQRMFDAPQIVFRVEAHELLRGLATSDRHFHAVVEAIKKLNRATMRYHPNLAWTVGWLRVHVDDANRLVFVDEIQSDPLEWLRKMAGFRPWSQQIESILRPWNLHGFASVCNWAQAIGYAVGTHSEVSRDYKLGMTKSARKWDLHYDHVIRLFGLREDSLPGYPAPVMTDRNNGKSHEHLNAGAPSICETRGEDH